MRHSNAIKNLSIAIEALSRVPGYDAENCFKRIGLLLTNLIQEEENQPAQPPTPPAPDEEIPF